MKIGQGTVFKTIPVHTCARTPQVNQEQSFKDKKLLVARRATYVVDGRFFGHFFWKVEGTVRTHVNSRVAHVWLPYMVINVQAGGGRETNIGKLGKFGNFKICTKVTGSIVSYIGSYE